jgi:exonuclease III
MNVAMIEDRMEKMELDIVCIQDHGLSNYKIDKRYVTKPDKVKSETNWIGYDPTKDNKARTLAIVRNAMTEKISSLDTNKGCWMSVTAHEIVNKPIKIINIYVPPSGAYKNNYLNLILNKVKEAKKDSYVILAGDFNLVRNVDVDMHRNYKTLKAYSNINNQFYQDLESELVDSVVAIKKDQNRYTRRGEWILQKES